MDIYISVQEILGPQKHRGYKTKPSTYTEPAETVLKLISQASHLRCILTFSSHIHHCFLNGSVSEIKNISVYRHKKTPWP